MKRWGLVGVLALAWCWSAVPASGQVVVGTTGVQLYAGTVGPYFGPWSPYGYAYYGYPYGPYYDPWPYYYGYYGWPPLFAPAESLYGPQAVQRFMGIGNVPPLIARPDADQAALDVQPPRVKVRPTNAETKARARRFIDYGDAHFANRKYNEALERYRTASTTAPDLAETFLREGHALVAMGQFDAAEREFRRGLGVRGDWRGTDIRLDEIYDGDNAAKTAHFEALARVVDENPDQAQPLFLLGMQLCFDGQAERSQLFFLRAAQLGGNDDHLLDSFLPPK